MALSLRFRAKSDMTMAEAERRLAAAAAVPVDRPAFPPSIVADRLAAAPDHATFVRALNGAAHQDEPANPGGAPEPVPLVEVEQSAVNRAVEECEAVSGNALPGYQPPAITITITGAAHAGKSVIAHLIRAALAREGIVFSGPEELRSIVWHKAVASLIGRGLTVELAKSEPGTEAAAQALWPQLPEEWRIALGDKLGMQG